MVNYKRFKQLGFLSLLGVFFSLNSFGVSAGPMDSLNRVLETGASFIRNLMGFFIDKYPKAGVFVIFAIVWLVLAEVFLNTSGRNIPASRRGLIRLFALFVAGIGAYAFQDIQVFREFAQNIGPVMFLILIIGPILGIFWSFVIKRNDQPIHRAGYWMKFVFAFLIAMLWAGMWSTGRYNNMAFSTLWIVAIAEVVDYFFRDDIIRRGHNGGHVEGPDPGLRGWPFGRRQNQQQQPPNEAQQATQLRNARRVEREYIQLLHDLETYIRRAEQQLEELTPRLNEFRQQPDAPHAQRLMGQIQSLSRETAQLQRLRNALTREERIIELFGEGHDARQSHSQFRAELQSMDRYLQEIHQIQNLINQTVSQGGNEGQIIALLEGAIHSAENDLAHMRGRISNLAHDADRLTRDAANHA